MNQDKRWQAIKETCPGQSATRLFLKKTLFYSKNPLIARLSAQKKTLKGNSLQGLFAIRFASGFVNGLCPKTNCVTGQTPF